MIKDFSYGVIPSYFDKDTNQYLFLLIHHTGENGYWGFPKGHKDGNESDVEAARRELAEETGIREVEILEKSIFLDKYTYSAHGNTYDKTVTFYLGLIDKMPELNLQLSEVDDAKWLPYDQALSLPSFDTLVEILKETNDWLAANKQ